MFPLKKKNVIISFVLGAVLCLGFINRTDALGIYNPFLPGPVSLGIGSTGVSLPDPGYILNNNPAALAKVDNLNVQIMYYSLYDGGFKCIGAEVDKKITDHIAVGTECDFVGQLDSDAYSFLFFINRVGASYNMNLMKNLNLSVGASVLINNQSIEETTSAISYSSTWFNFCGGALVTVNGLLSKNNMLYVGAKLSDVASESGAGVSYYLSTFSTLLSYSFKYIGEPIHSFGIEKAIGSAFWIRAGFENMYFHCGMSMIVKMVKIDYAFGSNSFGVVNQISIGMRM